MKQFKIVKLTGTTGAVKYQVQHRVQFLGINLWWSNTWPGRWGSLDAEDLEDVRNKLTQFAEQMENYELGIESPSVVKETVKGLESELVCKRDIAVERSSRCMFVSRIENCGTTPMTGEDVLALLNDCDMLASREFDLPSRLEITYGDAAIDAAMAAGEKA